MVVIVIVIYYLVIVIGIRIKIKSYILDIILCCWWGNFYVDWGFVYEW